MTNPSFNPDDPRLTAFVLGELNDADRAAVEQLLEASPEARVFVDDLQETIGVLRDELSTEPAPALTDEQRSALHQAAELTSHGTPGTTRFEPSRATHRRRGVLLGMAATVAALAVVVTVLPEFGLQPPGNSSDVALSWQGQLADDESAVASAESSIAMSESETSRPTSVEAAIRGVAPFEHVSNQPAEADSARSDQSSFSVISGRTAAPLNEEQAFPADALPTAASQALVKSEPATAAGAAGSAPVAAAAAPQTAPGEVPLRGGFDGLNKQRAAGTKLPLATTGNAPSKAAVAGKATAVEGFSSADRSASDAPKQVDEMSSGLAATARPESAQPVSNGPGLAGAAPASPVARPVPGTSGQPVVRYSTEAEPVSAPVPAASEEEARRFRGRTLQTDGQQPGQPVRIARITGRPVVGEALGEQKEGEALVRGGRRMPVGKDADDRLPGQYGRGIGGGLVARPGNENYEPIIENDFVVPDPSDREKRLSTISVDVDTASYANVRRFLTQNQLPPPNAVRIEELVNYFKYDYPQPEGDDPFSVTTEIMLCPWQPRHRLARIGLQARTIDKSQRPPTNLVFLLDVSGSMRPANKLPLVQQAMRLLVEEMTEDDQIAIVTYASNAGLRLVSTPGSKKSEILQSIDSLTAGGSTNGEGGIKLAYDTAIRHYIQDGANRVILCTDGDFNVGVSNDNELVELIQEKAASGVFLSVFGFGMGNLKDGKLEKLADKGNGQYGYIDNLQEARRAFNEDLAGTLYTVAKDVKLQAEFNPATVGAYRLIGYENRKLAAADFNDDTKDAGEIGAGHTVTALYEIVPLQVLIDEATRGKFRYRESVKHAVKPPTVDGFSDELFFVRLRYKKPDEETSQPVEADFPVSDITITGKPVAAPSADFQFAAAVASFGMNLRGSQYRGTWTLANVDAAAQQLRGEDADGRRGEFLDLVKLAMRLKGLTPTDAPATEDHPAELSAKDARIKAAVDGKYRRLLKKIEVRDDVQQYGAFNDFGFWDKSAKYKGHSDLLPGYWVYVYPNWYIWGDVDEARASSSEAKADAALPASKPGDSAGRKPAEPAAKR